MVNEISTCRNCATAVTGNYCSGCGQPLQVKRVDFHYISHEVQHLLHFEKGFLYTVKELLLRPGHSIKEFIAHNRSRLVKPVIFLIITSLLYTTAIHFFHVNDQYIKFSSDEVTATTAIFDWIQNHYGYGNIMIGIFIAWWVRLFFKGYGFNYFETLILLCFTMGMAMLILAVFAVAQGVFKVKLMEIGSVIWIIYCSWAIGDFFDRKRIMNYVKALIAYFLGMVTFAVLAFLTGSLIDVVMKHTNG